MLFYRTAVCVIGAADYRLSSISVANQSNNPAQLSSVTVLL